MGGAGLIAIKRRIKSVTNTRKITKAMGLVATAKLRKAREKLTVSENYHNRFRDVLKEIFENYDEDNIYTDGNGSRKKLYITFTSDTGLCGGFNISVINNVVEQVKQDRENSKIIVIGQKGKSYFNKLKYETEAEYVEVPDLPGVKEAEIISRHVLELYEKSEIGEVLVVYTRFVSAVKQEIETQKLLPLGVKSDYLFKPHVLFEPELSDVIADAVRQYLNEHILFCMLNSKTSEHSARMNAMNGATNNANDLLERLNIKYNRVRQSAITQEISEIVGGAEAQR